MQHKRLNILFKIKHIINIFILLISKLKRITYLELQIFAFCFNLIALLHPTLLSRDEKTSFESIRSAMKKICLSILKNQRCAIPHSIIRKVSFEGIK